MNWRRVAVFGCLSIAIGAQALHAARAALELSVVMTPQELHETGIWRLNGAERRALDDWLNRYTEAVLRIALNPSSGATPTVADTSDTPFGPVKQYRNTGRAHWIQAASESGERITLEDGSLWEISALNRVNTAAWTIDSEVAVIQARVANADYRYELIKTDDGGKALARFLGMR